jgi:hypothetical protein
MQGHSIRQAFDQLGLNSTKAVIASVSEIYRMPQEQVDAIKFQLISEAFRYLNRPGIRGGSNL